MRTFLLAVLLLLWALCCAAQTPSALKITDVRSHIGETVTVEGRTGVIEKNPPAGVQIITLRDDYGDMIKIRERTAAFERNRPIMGVHYFVTGLARLENGQIYLDAKPEGVQRDAALLVKPERPGPPVLWFAIAALLLGLVAVYFVSRPPPVWGRLEVVKGEESAAEFLLRGKRIPIGRSVKSGVRIFQRDPSVSREQGVILRKGREVTYRNTSGTGTLVDGIRIGADREVGLPHGALIEMGKAGAMLKFSRLDQADSLGMSGVTLTDTIVVARGERETEQD